jgi:hypothetical protein
MHSGVSLRDALLASHRIGDDIISHCLEQSRALTAPAVVVQLGAPRGRRTGTCGLAST